MSNADPSIAIVQQVLKQLDDIRKDYNTLQERYNQLQNQAIELAKAPVQSNNIQALTQLAQIANTPEVVSEPMEKKINDVADLIVNRYAKLVNFK